MQFRVSGGDDYQFTNEEDAAIFKSYEFELWDTQKNTEYEIPDGEYISVTVPVKAGYTYSIEHLLDNGAYGNDHPECGWRYHDFQYAFFQSVRYCGK